MTEREKSLDRGGVLTARINATYREVESLARSTIETGIELGGMLAEKKAALAHGEWLPWLRGNFEGSERHAQRFMQLYSERDRLLADPTRVSDLSLSGAFKEIATPRQKELPSPAPEKKEEKPATFEDVAEMVGSFRAIRDRELFREKEYDSFDAYLAGEFPERAADIKEVMDLWEPVVDNPPPELRGAPLLEKTKELTARLGELAAVPEPGCGLVVVGRRLREIEERELYKLIGYRSFSHFCRERLALSGKHQSLLSIVVELADIDPFFNMDASDPLIPENFAELDWERALPLLEEFAELSSVEEGRA
jgi:hypothetical protein